MIHAPSLAIGAIIASITITLVIFGVNNSSNEIELSIEPTPEMDQIGPKKITIDTFLSNGSPILGDPNAPITLVEFGDYQCHYCNVFFQSIEKDILKNYVDTGKVKFAFKHLPLPFHSNAQKASEATECAGKLGKDDAFWGMHDAIFDNQARGMSVSQLKGYAADLGLDQGDFDSCLDNGDMEAKVKAHAAEAAKLGASGTPTFFINGVKLVGAQPYAAFEAAIEAAL